MRRDLLGRLSNVPHLKLLPPLGYVEFMSAVMSARFVLTDSGGVQEETTYLGIPCLTLRDNTERPITISQGSNRLVKLETLEGGNRQGIGRSNANWPTPGSLGR